MKNAAGWETEESLFDFLQGQETFLQNAQIGAGTH
jgi:hypothetical protein